MVGAVGFAYSVMGLRKRDLLTGLATAAMAALFQLLLAGFLFYFRGHRIAWYSDSAAILCRSLAVYIPISYLVEEVVFRGVLDPHLHVPGERLAVPSGVLLSIGWGLWHLGTARTLSLEVVLGACIVQGVLGSCLTWGMRRTGNLLVPAIGHAVADAIRNAMW